MPMSERVCIICEKTYTPWNRDQKCCTKECMDQNLKNRLKKRCKTHTCQNCGEDFTNFNRGIKRRKFCSKECVTQDRQRKIKENKLGNCIICGKELPTDRPKLCSEECAVHAKRIQSRERDRKRGQSRKEKAWAIKREFVDKKGGCCEKCGYDNCLAALTFHHIDENTKEYTLDIGSIQRYKKELLEKELDKCQLLCFNCHMELHHAERIKEM